ncbi:MAG: PAS domain-containing hybrid sensor histidine kinase/response regulator [Thauera sp.]
MKHWLSPDRLRNLADFLLPALLVAAILAAAALFGYARIADSTDEIERDTQQRLDRIAEVVEFIAMLNSMHAELHGIVAQREASAPDTTASAPAEPTLGNRLTELESRFDAMGAWVGDAAAHSRAKANLRTYRALVLTLLGADAHEGHEAVSDLAHAEPLHDEFLRYTNTLVTEVAADTARANADDLRRIQARLDQDLTGSLAVIVLALALAVMLAMRLAEHRDTLAQAVRRLADDELAPEHFEALARLGNKKGDRLGGLAQALIHLREARCTQKDNETLFRAVIEQAPCAIELVDPVSLRFLHANAYSRQALGYTEAELRKRTVMDIQAELPQEGIASLAQQALSAGALHFDTVHRASDGRLFDASVRLRAINLDGRDYLLGIWQDVSAERQAKQALEKFSLAIEQSPNAVVITDTDARIEYVNEAFVQTSGFTREEAVGANPRLLKSGRTAQRVYAEMWAALTQGETWRGELINRRKDGSEFIEQAHISPIRQPDGRITHYLAIKQDVTEKCRLIDELERHRSHLEQLVAERSTELLAARNAAEVANDAKSEFLANMSHEIRTPLNAIIGLGHLLARDLREDDQKARVTKITAAARHLLQIINDILDLSKIEAGRLDLEVNDFDPAAMLEGTLELVREQAEQKGLELSLALEALPPRVRGDALRLGQIVLNFASNAVKFTAQGSVTVSAHVISAQGEQLRVRFEVTDTGIGIDQDQSRRIFQPFEQADPSTTRKYGGTGLGLAISRRLAELMGGRIGVESAPGKGSTFWVEVPLQARPGGDPQPGAAARATVCGEGRRLLGRRILLAEDNPVNREVAATILRETGATVDTAENGQEAVDMAKASHYDLILMDLQMPVMDGITATRLLRSSDAFRDLPIVAMTANAFAEDRKLCIDAGMNDHIPKPVEPDVLCEKVARWVPTATPGADLPTATPGHATTRERDSDLGDPLACLAGIHELDVAAGLHYVLGERQIYLGLLRLFVEGGYGKQLQDAVDAGNTDALRRTAHAIKGSAATIGATALSKAAAELEARVASGSPDAAESVHHGALREAGNALAARTIAFCEALEGATRAGADEAGNHAVRADEVLADTNAAHTAEVLATLEHQLTLGDISVRELLKTHRGMLRAVFRERFTRFEHRVGDFDFEAALVELRAANEARERPRPD